MEINVGMKRAGLRAFANEILKACSDTRHGVEVTRRIQPNSDVQGLELTLVLSNEDMERDDLADDAAYWE